MELTNSRWNNLIDFILLQTTYMRMFRQKVKKDFLIEGPQL